MRDSQTSYLCEHPGYYLTGDGGYLDEDGYLFVMGRIDDVINVAGHRLSTGQMEAVARLPSRRGRVRCDRHMTTSARGSAPWAWWCYKDGVSRWGGGSSWEQELVAPDSGKIGARGQLPSTLSSWRACPKPAAGKILRKTLRQLADGEDCPIPPTIDDPLILDESATASPSAA